MNEPHETIQDVLALLAQRQPAAPAIHVPGRSTLTYGELGAQIRYVRERLRSWDIHPGDVVGAALSSRPELAVAIATLPVSCTFAPLAPTLASEAYAELLTRIKAKAVLVSRGDEHAIRAAARRLGIAEIDLTSERDGAAGLFTLTLGRGETALATCGSGDARFAYVLTSSGTTGRAKLVPFEHRTLLLNARAISEWLDFRPGDTGVHVTPLYLGNGLCALVNTLVMGHSMACLQQADIPGFFASIEEYQPTFMIAGFSLFQGILSRAPEFRRAAARSRFRFLRAGSGRLDPDDADRLEQLLGAPMLIGLATSETLLVSHDPLPPRPRKRGSVGLPVLNEVALLNDSGVVVLGEGLGEIVARGPLVFQGYLDDPRLTAASFTGSWFRTGDLGRIDADGYVHITGRLKEIINRGGEKISPVEIDIAIESLAGIKEAAAFGIPHPSLGEEMVAAVVREKDATIDEAQVVERVLERVGARKVPRRVFFVERLPRTDNGKLRRSALPGMLSLKPGSAGPSAPSFGAGAAMSPLESALAGLWSSLLGVAKVGRDDDFFLLGGDSLRGIQLIAQLEALFGVELPMEALFGKAATVRGMARVIEPAPASDRGSWTSSARADERGIHPRREKGPLPLSHTQMRMWFVERLDRGSSAYNLTSAHRLTGSIDVEALRESLAALVQRHEILRTTYTTVDDEPRQIVHEIGALDFRCLDVVGARGGDHEDALLALIQAEGRRPFQFDVGPLARFRLIRLADCDHILMRAWHHIVADGWSDEVFEGELSVEYAARVRGTTAVLPAPRLQYADYALWQRAWLRGEEGERQLKYWLDELKDLPTLELPTDRARPAVQSHRGTRWVIALPGKLVDEMTALGRVERATPFMTLLTAFMVLLHRYTGKADVAVGTQMAGRQRAELNGLMGVFLNTLVLRGDLTGEPSFRTLLARVRARALAAYANQDVPFEKLVEELAPSRDLGRNPLFQVSCVWRYPGARLELEGLRVSSLEPLGYSAKFDLTLILRDTPEGLQAAWEYSTDLFEDATIKRMARHFERLLEGVVADPDRRIGELPLLTPPERDQLLVAWNDTAAVYHGDRTLHLCFEEQAARTPSAVAVVCEDRQLTYGELDARANQLAHGLIARGVGPGVLVGVCLERSLDLIVGLLGILKASGAYVPLDPSYPLERLVFMLEDSQASVLVAQERLLDRLPAQMVPVLCLDRDWRAIAAQPATPPPGIVSAASLAYVLYTSGSTGAPKGVMIEHRALVNHMDWMREAFGFDCDDRVLQRTPISFDAAMWELFAPLMVGGRLVMAPPDAHRDPAAIIKALRDYEVTAVQLVPSLFRLLVESPRLADCAKLAKVFCGGEVLRGDDVQRFFGVSSARLYNLYGPTEACIDALWWECQRDDRRMTVPIGRPIANTVVYVLDPYRQPVPVGVGGELYIGGDGLARGYWNRPELTAERFVEDSFSRRPGARMYRTGDRARYRPDGNVEFLGRVDHQVKLRGFRIELSEIEAVLARHPKVCDVVVLLREGAPGDSRLVAYVVAGAGEVATDLTRELRAGLRASLPEHMVPTDFVLLPRLPLLPNGKVDRNALPAPTHDLEEPGGTHVPVSTPLETLIAEVWCEVLGIEYVGVRDNFFDLGGHSLLAAQVVSRLTKLLKVELPLRRMFEAPTIAELARDAALRRADGP